MPDPGKREQVLAGVFALLRAAVPDGDVARNASKPSVPASGGTVRMADGDPGEPAVDLGPVAYNWEHRIPLEILAADPAALDAVLALIGTAVLADRTLGGLCEYLDIDRPAVSDLEAQGAKPLLWADAAIIAHYRSTSPFN